MNGGDISTGDGSADPGSAEHAGPRTWREVIIDTLEAEWHAAAKAHAERIERLEREHLAAQANLEATIKFHWEAHQRERRGEAQNGEAEGDAAQVRA